MTPLPVSTMRQSLGVTQLELCKALDIQRHTLSDIEAERVDVDADTYQRIKAAAQIIHAAKYGQGGGQSVEDHLSAALCSAPITTLAAALPVG